jgi:hypothetical protein
MQDKFTQGEWVVRAEHPTTYVASSWHANPPLIAAPSGDIAKLVTSGKSAAEISANAELLAAAPAMARALARLVFDPTIRSYLKATNLEALDRADAALETAGLLS